MGTFGLFQVVDRLWAVPPRLPGHGSSTSTPDVGTDHRETVRSLGPMARWDRTQSGLVQII